MSSVQNFLTGNTETLVTGIGSWTVTAGTATLSTSNAQNKIADYGSLLIERGTSASAVTINSSTFTMGSTYSGWNTKSSAWVWSDQDIQVVTTTSITQIAVSYTVTSTTVVKAKRWTLVVADETTPGTIESTPSTVSMSLKFSTVGSTTLLAATQIFVTSPIVSTPDASALNTFAAETYMRLPEYLRDADGTVNSPTFPLYRFIDVAFNRANDVYDLWSNIRYLDPNDEGGYQNSQLVNPDTAKEEWLPWIASILGAKLGGTAPTGYTSWGSLQAGVDAAGDADGVPSWTEWETEPDISAPAGVAATWAEIETFSPDTLNAANEARWQVSSAGSGIKGGTSNALRSAAQHVLTGTKSVTINGNVGGDPWKIEIVTLLSETPDVVVIGGSSGTVLDAVELVVPAGFEVVHRAANILAALGAVVALDAAQSVLGEQAVVNQGSASSTLNARYGTGSSVDGSDPALLTHTGTNHLYLTGIAGNYVSAPNKAEYVPTGSIELVVRVSSDNWLVGSETTFVSCFGNAGNRGYRWYMNSGYTYFGYSVDGTTLFDRGGVYFSALTNGQTYWLKATFNPNDGAGNNVTKFYYAADQTTEAASWTPIGASTSVAGVGSVFHCSAPLEIGSRSSGISAFGGRVYRGIVRNGIDGAKVFDVDFTTGITSGNQVSVPFTETGLASPAPHYVSNLGTGGRALVAKVGNSANADTNDPLLLTHTGENYLYMAGGAGGNASVSNNFAKIPDNGGAMDLIGTPGITYLSLPGIVGHYASTPSNAALQIAGDIDVVFGCSFNTLTSASSVGLFGRDGADPNRVWALTLTTTGALSFRWYPTGSLASQIITTSTVTLPSVGITAGQRVNLRVTLDVDNLSSSNEVKFYYSTDFGATYTQLGATVTTAGVTSLSTTTSAALTINPDLGGTPFAGKVYIAVVRSGIGGTNVFISDFTTAIMGSSTFVDGGQVAANGMLVTLNGSLAKFVDGTTLFSQALPNDYTAVAGSFVSYCTIPDNAAFTPTTSISYRFAVAANNWTPDRDAYLGGHYISTTNNRSSLCRIGSGAVCRPAMLLSPDGTGTNITTDGASVGLASVNATTTVAAALGSMTNGSPYVIRYDYITTGTSASVSFFAKTTSASAASSDALSDTGWTAVGTPVTSAIPYSLFNATATMSIGGLAGNPPVAGRHYAAVVKVDGVTQVNIDFTQQALYATSFTETSTNLATVTVTGGSNNDARIDRVRDIELVCRLALDDWTCATSFSSQNLISKGYGTDYLWFITNTNFQFYGTIGAATGNFIALPWSLASRPANGVTVWMKVTRNSTTGAIVLYTAPDSVTEPSSWTTVTTNTNIIGNFKGNTGHPTAIGGAVLTSSTQSSIPATGKFYRAIVRNGIGGPAVVDVDFTKSITSGAQTSMLTGGTTAQYSTNLSTVSGASVMTARSGTLPASDGADPVLLPWTGENYLYTTGVAGNYASTPNNSVLNITGAIEMVGRCSGIPVSAGYLFLKGSSYATRAYSAALGPTGALGFWSRDSVLEVKDLNSAAVLPYGATTRFWWKITADPVSGNVNFYHAADASAEPSTWKTLGGTQNASFAGGAFTTNTDTLLIGNALNTSFYRGIVRNGIGGTTVFDANFTTGITSGSQTSFVESSVNAATVTISRTLSGRKAVAVTRPTWVFGSSDFMEVQDNALLDVTAAENLTVVAIVRQWGTPTNYGRYISKKNGNPAAGWELLTSTTTTGVFLEIADGTNTTAAPVVTPTTGALAMVGAQINRSSNTLRNFVNTTFSTTVSTTALTGTLANGFPMRIGKRADFSGNQDFELVAVAVFKSVVSDANLTNIYNHYINGSYDATTILQGANFWIDAALSPPALAITRSTSDHKSVAVVRPTFLFGGNDYMEVADNDLLDFGLTDSFTLVAAIRHWATISNDVRIFSKGTAGTPSSPTISLLQKTSFGVGMRMDAGVTQDVLSPVSTAGALTVFSGVRNTVTDSLVTYSGASAGASVTDNTTLAVANTAPFRIGADYGSGTAVYFGEFEMYGAAVFRKALTATEIALINTHYQGTETTESIALLSTAVFWIDPAKSSQEMAINRSTTGRKSVAVTRPIWLFGLDDYMEIVDSPLLQFGTEENLTVTAIYRQWATVGFAPVISRRSNAGGFPNGWELDAGYTSIGTVGSTSNFVTGGFTAPTPGTLSSLTMTRSSAGLIGYINNTAGTPVITAGYYGDTNPSVAETIKIGARYTAASTFADMELVAVGVFRKALTATEIAQINAYYGIS